MKKIVWVIFSMFAVLLFPVKVIAADMETVTFYTQEISDGVEELQDKLKEAIEGADEQTVQDIFSFLKEKDSEGSFSTQEGVKAAIEEGREKFNASISDKDIETVVEVMGQLEDLGFDISTIVSKAEDLYQEYGADFVNHTQELITETIKESVITIIKEAVKNFFISLWESIKSFVQSLF